MATTIELSVPEDHPMKVGDYGPVPVGFEIVAGERYVLDIVVPDCFEVLGVNTATPLGEVLVHRGLHAASTKPVDLAAYRPRDLPWTPIPTPARPWLVEFELMAGKTAGHVSLFVWVTRKRASASRALAEQEQS